MSQCSHIAGHTEDEISQGDDAEDADRNSRYLMPCANDCRLIVDLGDVYSLDQMVILNGCVGCDSTKFTLPAHALKVAEDRLDNGEDMSDAELKTAMNSDTCYGEKRKKVDVEFTGFQKEAFSPSSGKLASPEGVGGDWRRTARSTLAITNTPGTGVVCTPGIDQKGKDGANTAYFAFGLTVLLDDGTHYPVYNKVDETHFSFPIGPNFGGSRVNVENERHHPFGANEKWDVGDTGAVMVNSKGQIEYYHNSKLLYTSTYTPTFPLHAFATVHNAGDSITCKMVTCATDVWSTVAEVEKNTGWQGKYSKYEYDASPAVKTRFIRLDFNENNWNGRLLRIYELFAYESKTTSTQTTSTKTGTVTTTTMTTTTATTTTTTATPCGAGEYLSMSRSSGGSCKPCPYSSFRADSYPHWLEECVDWQRCDESEFEVATANATHNYVCQSHTECADGEYESRRPSPGLRDRECTPITQCVTGQYVYRVATTNSDQACRNCDGSSASFAAGLCTTTTKTQTSRTSTTETETTQTSTTGTETATSTTMTTVTSTMSKCVAAAIITTCGTLKSLFLFLFLFLFFCLSRALRIFHLFCSMITWHRPFYALCVFISAPSHPPLFTF
jgi:hypothetical protein